MEAYEWIGVTIVVAALITPGVLYLARWHAARSRAPQSTLVGPVSNRILNMRSPQLSSDAVTREYVDTEFNFRPAPRPEARCSLDATGYQKLPRVVVYTGDDDDTIPVTAPKWIRDHTTSFPVEQK